MIESRNPATGAVVFATDAVSPEDVAAAVAGSAAAARDWAARPAAERSAVLARFGEIVERDTDELAGLVVAEVGKRREEARGEVEWTALSARRYAEHPPRVERRGDAVDLEAPFGGVKDSGNGLSEGGEYVYAGLTSLQAVYGHGGTP